MNTHVVHHAYGRQSAATAFDAILDEIEHNLYILEIRRVDLQAQIDGIAIQQPAVATEPPEMVDHLRRPLA